MKTQSERLGKEPVAKLLRQLAVPATVGVLVMALYNVVDTIYISRGVGTLGVAALSIAFPIQMLVMALAAAIGIGGGSYISRLLGAGDQEKANRVFANAITLVLIVSITGAFLGLSMLTPMLRLFGSSETILPYARDYMGIILYGTFLFTFGFSMNNIVRAEGNARTAMLTMVISAVLNIIITPIFIFGFDMGIKGAAYGTLLAKSFTVVYLAVYYATGKSSLSFNLRYMIPDLSLIRGIMAVGASAFVRMGSGSLMMVVANNMLGIYGGDLAIAVLGIVVRVMMFSLMPILGIVQGMLPLAGFNYGAGLHQRVSDSILLAMKAATAIAAVAFVMVMLFAGPVMMIFTDDPAVVEMGRTALRIYFSLSFTVGITMVTGGVFQALGKAKAAFVLSLSRQVLFLIPLLVTLPLFMQLYGIWLAYPIADLLSFLLVIWFMKRYDKVFRAVRLRSMAASL